MAIIQGTNGNDIPTGSSGDDWANPTLRERIIGSAGDDTLSGGGGNDTLDYSGLGKPITVFRGVVFDKGGLGTDRISIFLNIVGATGQANTLDATGARGGAKIDIDLTKNTFNVNSFQLNGVTIPIPEVKVFNSVNASGDPNDDKLVGSNTGGKLTGAGGNDKIVGGKGKDIITGNLFSGTDPSNRDLIAKIQLKGGLLAIEREYQIRPNHRKKSTQEIVLLSCGTIVTCIIVTFSFSVVWKECSRLFTNDFSYPSYWR